MFSFGKNWKSFLEVVDEDRILEAQKSLKDKLGRQDLKDLTFLDIGCGSGLFSLAAVRLGAKKVLSIDYDVHSVECSSEMKRRFSPDASHWEIRQGSVLDQQFLATLGSWDIVYSWGVLHHTGNMNQALANVAPMVPISGTLFISIYNDQGFKSRAWTVVKRAYNSNFITRSIVILIYIPYFFLRSFVGRLVRLSNPFSMFKAYKTSRGMSRFHDWIDWIGGYPFEVAKPETILDLYREKGFVLIHLKTCAGELGCNEYVFTRTTTEFTSSRTTASEATSKFTDSDDATLV